jgi:hypothetical protein
MSEELTIFKQNKISALQNTYNYNVSKLNSNLVSNVRNVQSSRISQQQKTKIINSYINQYFQNINSLKTALNNSILSIQNYTPPQIIINKNKKALLVGINYAGTQNELFGCINDVNCIKDRISKEGFKDITILTDLSNKKATKNNILQELKNLLLNSQPGDLLFFAYSGHGTYIDDRNADEIVGYDQCIVPCDLNIIVDDELKNIIQQNLKQNVTLFAMFDSCFSGSVLDLRYQYMDSLNYDKFSENVNESETKGDVFMISGCTDKQTSSDAVINNNNNGAMTWSLLEALKQKPNCTWRELIKTMR